MDKIIKIKRPLSKQPLPSNAKCVFKGVIYDVYQWEQKLYDGSTSTFEKLVRVDTVNVIPITESGKIIITQQMQPGKKPFIGFAGGRVDRGEDPLSAAKRELLEETGLKAQKYILWDAVQPVSTIDWAVYTFIAKGCRKVAEPNPEAGEMIKLVEISFENLTALVKKKSFRDKELVRKILAVKNSPKDYGIFNP
jgi:ADP-ribose pyrophosphatase